MRQPSPVLTTLVLTLVAHSARADGEPTEGDRLLARTLFEEGRTASKNGDYAKACPKFAESQRREPAIGTLFNLADCYEHQGRLAVAWTMFSDVAEESGRAGQADRASVAKQRADALAPRLPHLRVETPKDPDLKLTLDGMAFAAGLVDSAIPLDPGDHELGADAPGKQHWTARFRVDEGASTTITVPALDPAPPPPPGPLEASSTSIPDGHETGRASRARWQVPVAAVAAGLGVVGLSVGSALGVKAIDDWSTAKPGCSDNICSRQAYPYWHSAHAEGIGSTASFIAGGALLATGAVLWLVRLDRTTVRVGARCDGLVVGGTFR
jgi:hypothetical protein